MVQRTGDGQQDTDKSAENDDGNKVRKIQNSLYFLLDSRALDPIQKKGEQDRDREAPEKAVNTQLQCIRQISQEIRRGKKPLEILKADPSAAQDSADRVIILKCNQDSAHRKISEDNCQKQCRQQKEKIQLPVLSDIQHCFSHFLQSSQKCL